MSIFKKRGQLSLEFILLILGVLIAGASVTLQLAEKSPKFTGNESSDIKKDVMGLFVEKAQFNKNENTVPEALNESENTDEQQQQNITNETESDTGDYNNQNILINKYENTNTEVNKNENINESKNIYKNIYKQKQQNTTNETESDTGDYNNQNKGGVINFIKIHISGHGTLYILNDGVIVNNSNNIIYGHGKTIAGHSNVEEYSVNGTVDYLKFNHISGGANVTIHNVKKIENLKVLVTGNGHVYLYGVNITNAIIKSLGGGSSSNVYIINCYIDSATLKAVGGNSGWNEGKIYIINSTINSANIDVSGANAKINVVNSYINGEYYSNITILLNR
ncbi:class III signal peptide-containing protein [Methanocaldococcus sp. 28A]